MIDRKKTANRPILGRRISKAAFANHCINIRRGDNIDSSKNALKQTAKFKNRASVLQSVLNKNILSRANIARELNLTKTTLTNIVNDLIQDNILIESDSVVQNAYTNMGRKSVGLELSEKAPLICGFLIRRERLQVVFANLKGEIVAEERYSYVGLIHPDDFKHQLDKLFHAAATKIGQPFFAAGISSLGPLNVVEGKILNPHIFFSVPCEFEIVNYIHELTKVPTFFCNDASSGAVAEKLLGSGKDESNFIYITTFNGIGAGLYFGDSLYNGEFGQNGEMGHMSIKYDGEQCVCGNNGCLEVYANVANILKEFSHIKGHFPDHPLFNNEYSTIQDVLTLVDENDMLAMIVVSEYCRYLSFALSNLITQLNINLVIIAGSEKINSNFFEGTLKHMINNKNFMANYKQISVVRSKFGLNAPLYGSIAMVLDKVFSGELYPIINN